MYVYLRNCNYYQYIRNKEIQHKTVVFVTDLVSMINALQYGSLSWNELFPLSLKLWPSFWCNQQVTIDYNGILTNNISNGIFNSRYIKEHG